MAAKFVVVFAKPSQAFPVGLPARLSAWGVIGYDRLQFSPQGYTGCS